MNVAALIADIALKFPRSPVEAWEADYREALDRHEGPILATAYRDTMVDWAEAYPPRPAHILASIRAKPADRAADMPEPGDVQRDRRRERRIELFAGALAANRDWLERASAEGWRYLLEIHFMRLASACAHSEIDGGRTPDAALAWADEGTKSGRRHPRHGWIDERDAQIMRQAAESQARIRNKGLKIVPSSDWEQTE